MNNFIKILSTIIICFTVNLAAFAVVENQIPVSESYTEVIKSVKQQTSQPSEDVYKEKRTSSVTNETYSDKFNKELTDSQATEDKTVLSQEIKKQTKPKTSFTNFLFKFLFAMLWVAISSGFIYLILIAYKKLILKGRSVMPTYESMEHSLDTPKNFKEAIKIFLDKTKWN